MLVELIWVAAAITLATLSSLHIYRLCYRLQQKGYFYKNHCLLFLVIWVSITVEHSGTILHWSDRLIIALPIFFFLPFSANNLYTLYSICIYVVENMPNYSSKKTSKSGLDKEEVDSKMFLEYCESVYLSVFSNIKEEISSSDELILCKFTENFDYQCYC